MVNLLLRDPALLQDRVLQALLAYETRSFAIATSPSSEGQQTFSLTFEDALRHK